MNGNNKLRDYYNLLVPSLRENEFVRIVALRDKGKPTENQKVFYIDAFDDLQDIVNKFKFNWDLYISISTVKGNNGGTVDKLYRRQVLFFDFDKKDYPQYNKIDDFTSHVKRKLPQLFNHAIVDSGNGYHLYVAIQTTSDIKRATSINKQLSIILGADMKAVLPTQIARIPTSLNHKQDEPKPVNIINNTYTTNKFRPYKLAKLESVLSLEKVNQAIDENMAQDPAQEYNKFSKYYCIEKMLAEGCNRGERNFALGRITKYLHIQGYTESKALQVIKGWNAICRPPKNNTEVMADFKKYWCSDYKLLGCTLVNEADQAMLSKYCDRYQCETIKCGEVKSNIASKKLNMDNHLLQNKVMRKLSGNHYLILSILHINKQGLALGQINKEITTKKTKKPCLSYNTLKKILSELVSNKYISQKGNFYKLINIKNYGFGYTQFYYSATILLINKIITSQEYLVYLCLVKNLKQGNNVTYDSLSNELGLDKGNISKYINSLHESQILKIEKVYSDKGIMCNRYILIA